MGERASRVEGTLAVREEEGAFLVVRADDPEDWLARFEKDGEFPARAWAENMVLLGWSTGPPTPPGTRPGNYHPEPQGPHDSFRG